MKASKDYSEYFKMILFVAIISALENYEGWWKVGVMVAFMVLVLVLRHFTPIKKNEEHNPGYR